MIIDHNTTRPGIGNAVAIYLDGMLQKNVVKADDERGYIDRSRSVNGRKPYVDRLWGKVTIVEYNYLFSSSSPPAAL